jgi:putative addiction module component (TIGR02574 family)
MNPAIDMAAIKALPIDERIALAHAILDTVTEEAEAAGLTEAQKAELGRRLELYRNNPDDVVPWEEVKARVRARRRP